MGNRIREKEESAVVKCVICGCREENSYTTVTYTDGDYVLTIKKIPCLKCTNCGEIEFSFEVMSQLEAMESAWRTAVKIDKADKVVEYTAA